MQQKIQLVGTVLHEPDLIVLDEPFSGLDPINQGLFKETPDGVQARARRSSSPPTSWSRPRSSATICLISDGRAVLNGSLLDIKHQFGGNTYRLRVGGDSDDIGSAPGVVQADSYDDHVALQLANGADPAAVVAFLVERGHRISEFRAQQPDLEEIFIRAVREAKPVAREVAR